jgi:hypothetical protein
LRDVQVFSIPGYAKVVLGMLSLSLFLAVCALIVDRLYLYSVFKILSIMSVPNEYEYHCNNDIHIRWALNMNMNMNIIVTKMLACHIGHKIQNVVFLSNCCNSNLYRSLPKIKLHRKTMVGVLWAQMLLKNVDALGCTVVYQTNHLLSEAM